MTDGIQTSTWYDANALGESIRIADVWICRMELGPSPVFQVVGGVQCA